MATQMPERDDRADGEGVSMSELLASCAAATAVSTPPRAEPGPARKDPEHREPELRDEAA
ncbi:hypothetical protein AB0E83_07435 [Streptomyces sp. NPDC035033]|uniref:hypothetical protein n=1 Tax=Streptomyces sp. NPDC035033 TaxID=3155368 RepID=UPI0033D6912F